VAPAAQPPEPVAAQANALTVAGFEDVPVITGLTQPSNVEFAPDGKVFVAQRNGRIYVYDSVDDTTPTLFADLSVEVYDFWDRGLLGLAIDPAYPAVPFVYVLYTLDAASPGGMVPRWNDTCPTPPGATDDGCLAYGRLSRLEHLADANATAASETVLIEGFGQQYPSHSIGSLAFGADGALYASSGDGASFNFADWGQDGTPVNPLADPPGGTLTPPTSRGGALRAQSVRRPAGEPVLLNGAILRVDKMTGAALPTNPLAGHADANARRIIAYGLRNPFRFTVHPTTGDLWVGDVGWGTWEEIDRVIPGGAVQNLGWPCYEGAPRQSGYDGANLTLCEDLYATTQAVAPHYAYNHSAKVVTGETCPTGSSSISGLAVYNGGTYPGDYAGALFFADYSRDCIWVMRATAGVPDPTRISTFVSAAANPVDLQIGPGGDMFYVDIGGGAVRRLRYRAPTAVATATPMAGPAPLAVTFSGSASTPGVVGETLTYAWDLDGDGDFDDATGVSASRTYPDQVTVTVRLRVTDTRGVTDVSDPLTLQVGPPPPPNTPPVPVIAAPVAGTTWVVGTTLTFSGSATDAEDGALPSSALTWELVMMHCPSNCHEHVLQTFAGIGGGIFVCPDHEYPSHLELRLTATDSLGARTTVVLPLEPQTVVLTLAAAPVTSPPLQLGFGPTQAATPFTRTVIIGSTNSLSAPDQVAGGTPYTFVSWSDGRAASHNIVAPATPTTYTATFAESLWSTQDVGAVAAAGSLTVAGSTYTLRGSGADIWATADEFRFAFQNVTGDATITARLVSLGNTNAWAKAGVMMRDGLTAGARYVAAILPSATGNPLRQQIRTAVNGASGSTNGVANTRPVYLRVSRAGNTFKSFWSTNGVTFTQMGGTTTMTLPSTLSVGLAVTSHADGTLTSAVFDNVSITFPPPPPPVTPFSLYLEAEAATITAPLQNLADAAASGGRYIAVVAGTNSLGAAPAGGRATWSFSAGSPGTYRFWGRIINPTTNDDSFWARVDGGTWIKWNDTLPYSAVWQWVRLHNSDAAGAIFEVPLTAGAHTFEMAYREDGARLDRVYLTNTTSTP
jgi:glucose/arabinose dehydrogenase